MPTYENVYWAESYNREFITCTHPFTHTEQLFPAVKGYKHFVCYFRILKFLCVYSTLSCRTSNDVLLNSGWKTAIHITYWNAPRL